MAGGAATLARMLAASVVGLCATLIAAAPASAASPFANWAAVVIAGDYHAHSGARSPAFDNARQDVASALVKVGFSRDHIAEFSSSPDKLPPGVKAAKLDAIIPEFQRLAAAAPDGCLMFLTSHGSPGMVMMEDSPMMASGLAQIIDSGCPASKPAILILSACYSGSLIPTLAGPNRMILTAAAANRSSFGCGESDKYTYFDTCILQTLPTVDDFVALASEAKACVARREQETNMAPASEPQVAVGGGVAPILPFYSFSQH